MKLKLTTLLIGIGLTVLSLRGAEAFLAEQGTSRYAVRVAENATPAEKNAAAELIRYLEAICGSPPRSGEAPHVIYVGPGPEARRLLPDLDFDALEADEIVLRTVGDDLVLAGGRPRGTLYAVWEFLEKLGVRWWTSSESTVPQLERLALPQLNLRYAPPIRDRNAMLCDVASHPEFGVKLRLNGFNTTVGPEWGGNHSPLGFVHTIGKLIPAEEYFEPHPEYFALVDGRRVPDQLCLSQPEVRHLLVEKSLEWLRSADNPTVISVSQNDNYHYCRCPECVAFDAREGSPAGLMIDTVNQVAAAVEPEFPGVLVETLAYQYTRQAPKTVRPRGNVLVRLCSIECDFGRPLDDPANADFYRDLEEWSRIAPQLAVWDYVSNFGNYLVPHPNLPVLGPNLRLFAAHQVVSVLEQGDYQSPRTGELSALKTWVLSKLLWNPEADAGELVAEFLHGYYGAAAPQLAEYLEILESELAASGAALPCYHYAANFLSTPGMIRCAAAFDRAEAAVAEDPVELERVRLARLPLDFALILNYPRAAREPGFAPERYPVADMAAFAEATIARAETNGCVMVRENAPLSGAVGAFRQLAEAVSPLPPEFAAMPPDRIFDLQDGFFALEMKPEVSRIADPEASDGTAIEMRNAPFCWAASCSFCWPMVPEAGRWRLYAVAAVDGEPGEGNAFSAGSHHTGTGHTTAAGVPLAAACGGGYRVFDLGSHDLDAYCVIWVAPAGNPAVNTLRFDRIVMVKEEEGDEL